MAYFNRNKILFVLVILLSWCSSLLAQEYQSEKLAKIAKRVVLNPDMGDGATGYCDCGAYDGKSIIFGRDIHDVIYHIGYKLFSPEMKSLYPSTVYDFIERYMLELDCFKNEIDLNRQLSDDKVIIMNGSLSTIKKINPETSCSVNLVDDKYYDVEWKDGNNTLLNLAFPVQYELLLGMPKNEIEKKIHSQISRCSVGVSPSYENLELEQISDKIFQTKPVANYYVESLNTAKYYSKSQEGNYYPIFESNDKWHSAANLFQGVVTDISDYKMFIQQNLYGFNKDAYTITLQQWINYCRQNDIIIYFAIEEEREDGLKALLIAQSVKLGFNHMMSIIIPDNFVDNPKTVMKVTLNAYIPTQNVKELYQQYTNNPQKRI